MHLRWRARANGRSAGVRFPPSTKKKTQKTACWNPAPLHGHPLFLLKNDWCARGRREGAISSGGKRVVPGAKWAQHARSSHSQSTIEKWGCLSEFLPGIFSNEGWRAPTHRKKSMMAAVFCSHNHRHAQSSSFLPPFFPLGWKTTPLLGPTEGDFFLPARTTWDRFFSK